jgi:RNA polymerase sigma factor (sigma-70 family)
MAEMQLAHLLRRLRQAIGVPAGGETTDSHLLAQFVRDRNEQAFAALLERRGPMVLAVCRQVLGDSHDAEDAFQATFLVLAQKAASVRQGESLAGWLHRVAYHTALRARARAAQRKDHERQARNMAQPDSLSELAFGELRPVLHEEVNRLPGKFRHPVILCYLEGKTNEEAAAELGWPVGTVKGRLALARELLRSRLTRRGLALSAAVFAVESGRTLAREPLTAALTQHTLDICLHGSLAAVPSSVSTLAQATMNAMWYAKVKMVGLGLAALLVLGTAGGLIRGLTGAFPGKPGNLVGALAGADAAAPAGDLQPAAVAPQPKVDLFGDPLEPNALARLGTVRFRAAGGGQIAISPNGKLIATYSVHAPVVTLWDADTGRKLRTFDVRSVNRLTFSPDGRKLAIASHAMANEVVLYDVESGTVDSRHKVDLKRGIEYLAFSADGQKMLTMEQFERRAVLTDLKAGKEIARLEKLPEGLSGFLAMSPDAEVLVGWSSDQAIHAWNIRTGKELWKRPHKGYPVGLSFAGDNRLLLAENDYKVIPAMKGKPLHTEMIRSDLRVLKGATGEELHHWDGPKEGFNYAAFGPDGKTILASGQDGQTRILNADTSKELRRFPVNMKSAHAWALSADGRRLANVDFNSGVGHVWDVTSGKSFDLTGGHEGELLSIAFSPDGKRVVTGSGDRTARVWDAHNGKELGKFAGDLSFGHALALSPNGKLVAGYDAANNLFIWDFETRAVLAKFTVSAWGMPAFTPDGRRLIVADHEKVIEWDITAQKEVRRFATGKSNHVHAISRDGSVLAIAPFIPVPKGEEAHIQIWDVASGKLVKRLPADGSVTRIAFSADNKALAVAQHMTHTIHLWDLGSGREIRVIKSQPGHFEALAFSPDGRTLAWARSSGLWMGTIHVVELPSGEERLTWPAHTGRLKCLAFAPDSQRIVTGSADTTAVIWDVSGQATADSGKPSSEELGRLWNDLAGDAPVALKAMGRLQVTGTAVDLFRARLRPASSIDTQRIDNLIADLVGKKFEAREQADDALEKLEDVAEPALRRLLETKPTLEVTERVERLLKLLEHPGPDSLRGLRAVEVLEHLATPEAKAVLESLAKGAPEARRTREAAASLKRLAPNSQKK